MRRNLRKWLKSCCIGEKEMANGCPEEQKDAAEKEQGEFLRGGSW
jgi:hypothetical protein